MREEQLSEQLGELLDGIQVPEEIAQKIVRSLQADLQNSESRRQEQIAGLNQELTTVRPRMDQIYEDKLDGKINDEFWSRKQAGLREQQLVYEAQLSSMDRPMTLENVLNVQRVFELAKRARSLYLTRNLIERGQLLKSVLLNCTTDGATLLPIYRKPFDLIFQRAKT